MSRPETSVIIRTFNEEKHLPRLFEALDAQTYRNFEIVVVDSGSFDRTRDIAKHYANQVLQIESHDFTFGYSLNVGIQAAAGQYIAIVSAHTRPVHSAWLESLIAPLREDHTAMVYGRQLGAPASKFSEVQDFRRTFGAQRRVLQSPHFFANNANAAVRFDLWQQQPFDEALPGLEDIAWAKYWMEHGYQVVYEPLAALYHIHQETWQQVQRRYYREAVAAHWIGIKHRQQVVADTAREIGYMAADFYHVLHPDRHHAVATKGMLEQGREIVLFRTHKAIGNMRGLLDGAVMRNPVTREKMFFDRTCQAVVVQGAGHAALQSVTIPEIKPGDVLIKVAYEGICATDLEIFEGTLGYYQSGMAKYPIVPGHEFSGTVVATGARVANLHAGDRVVVECIQSCGTCDACRKGNAIGCQERREMGVIGRDGGYAEYVVCPARFAHRLPEHITLVDACLCEPVAVVLKGLKRLARVWGSADTAHTCAVVGGGPIGHLVARLLEQQGHVVTVFDRNARRLAYFQQTPIQTSQNLRDLAAFDSIVEATGDPDALDAILHHSAAGATLLLLGLPYARREFSFEAIVGYDKTIVGSVGSNAEDFDAALRVLPTIDTSAFTQHIFPLRDFQQAWVLARSHKHLKIILCVDEDNDTSLAGT
jgi:2-desacetyl-2-hydroxyethyl bacteriochlorophyllide A dehydrogenase